MNFSTDNVCAVVISYFPDPGFQERLRRISEQAKQVVVVDNCTEGEASSVIDIALHGKPQIELIKNSANLGVATALNQGIRKALKHGFLWIAAFDQDSVPQPDMVERMLETWAIYPEPEKLMVAGPQTIFPNCSPESAIMEGDRAWKEVTHVITSGSLISRKAFESVGYFLDSLFIDYVDIEFCLRLRDRGYRIIQVRDSLLLHDIGKISEHHILGKTVRTTHHEPVRRYYQFRNALLLHKAYKKVQPEWCRRNRIILLKILCLILLYEKKKSRKVAQIIKGILHGLLGRAGRSGEVVFNIQTQI